MNIKDLLKNKTALIIIAIIIIVVVILVVRYKRKKKAEAEAAQAKPLKPATSDKGSEKSNGGTISPCDADIAEAKEKASNMGACPKKATIMTCPHDEGVTYSANGCEEQVLSDKGWK